MTPLLIAQIVLTLFVFFMLLNSAAIMVYVERKVAALLQQRMGPYLVGPKGLLQPLADIIKLMFKEGLRLQVADVNVAILVVFAISSMSVYGIVLAGWSSNSKYSLLGGLRSSAQMISYELSYGLALAGVLLIANSLSLSDLVNRQGGVWLGFIPKWFLFLQPVGFIIFMTAGTDRFCRSRSGGSGFSSK